MNQLSSQVSFVYLVSFVVQRHLPQRTRRYTKRKQKARTGSGPYREEFL